MTPSAEKHPNETRFEDFFTEDRYVVLKNYLYNYVVRKRAITRAIAGDRQELILEVGSGLSPILVGVDHIVYSELSFQALRTLKSRNGRGHYVVADGTRLPFKNDAFSHTICSEVLEHVEDDRAAIKELARVMKAPGHACITVPHRKFYFAADDRFVRHFRRYEIPEMTEKLSQGGLTLRSTTKVLGPLEKLTMWPTVMGFSILQRLTGHQDARPSGGGFARRIAPLFKWLNLAYSVLARIDAKIMPRALATVILFEAEKTVQDTR